MDFFSLAQNIYRLDYRDMVQKLHCPFRVRSMGIEMGLEWAKEKEQTGTAWPRHLTRGHLPLRTTGPVPIPMCSGDTSAAPSPMEVLQLLPSGCFASIQYSVAHDL